MLNYNETIKAMRELGRDKLRLNMTNTKRAEIYGFERYIAEQEAAIAGNEKSIAIIDFKITKVDDADPTREEQLVTLTKDKKYFEEDIARYNQRIEEYKVEIEKLETVIMEIQEGKIKVSNDRLNEMVESLIVAAVNKEAELIK